MLNICRGSTLQIHQIMKRKSRAPAFFEEHGRKERSAQRLLPGTFLLGGEEVFLPGLRCESGNFSRHS
jgi:hypothetical protein